MTTTWIYPGTHLHMLRGWEVDLSGWTQDALDNQWKPMLFQAKLIEVTTPGLATISGTKITATTNVGSTLAYLVLQSVPPDPPVDFAAVPFRISVYKELLALHCSHAHHTLETGRSDRVLVVYATFKAADDSIVVVDVTSHPFLHCTAPSGAGIAVTDYGRVTSNTAGTWNVTIGVKSALGISVTGTVEIEVITAPTEHPILETLHRGLFPGSPPRLVGGSGAQRDWLEVYAGAAELE